MNNRQIILFQKTLLLNLIAMLFNYLYSAPLPGAPEFFARGAKFKKRALFLLKRHCQQKQILVVVLQFEISVD